MYGSPRVTAELRAEGLCCGENRVARLMRVNGIRAKTKRKVKVTTDSRHRLPVAPNLLDRQFPLMVPTKPAGRISPTSGPRKVGGIWLGCLIGIPGWWSMNNRVSSQLTRAALTQALGRRHVQPGLLPHSDRGRQYAAGDY